MIGSLQGEEMIHMVEDLEFMSRIEFETIVTMYSFMNEHHYNFRYTNIDDYSILY